MTRPDTDSHNFCQPVVEQVLENVITSLVLTYRKATSPIPLPRYLGLESIQREVECGAVVVTTSLGEGSGKDLTWMWGLGLEVSPIKTRSDQKKLGQTPSVVDQDLVSAHDLGELRGMKALARAKS
jgi:hypothetical protein